MKRYEDASPRALLAVVAIAMTAITIGAMVVLPANLEAATVAGDHMAAALTCNAVKEKS